MTRGSLRSATSCPTPDGGGALPRLSRVTSAAARRRCSTSRPPTKLDPPSTRVLTGPSSSPAAAGTERRPVGRDQTAPMTTPRGGRLTRADEWPRHQVARTFDSVASDSPHWSDGYYFTASDDAGTASLYTAIRLYANTDVVDGYACVGIDGRQHNLRWSRRLRPAIDDLAVGPLRVEVLEPLERLRTTCARNPYGISYDLTWTGLHEPYLEAYAERWAAGRLTAQRCNYDQCCDVSGWLEVDGRRLAVTPDTW